MLKTQPIPSNFSSRLDRSVVEKTKYANNPAHQYLDVALARGSADLEEKRTKGNKQGKYSVKGLTGPDRNQPPKGSVPVGKTFDKGTVSGGGDKRVGGVNKLGPSGARAGKASKEDVKKETAHTFKEKAKFESQKNQKLFQELDDMLAGKQGKPYPSSHKHKLDDSGTSAKQTTARKDKINLVTKETLFPGISKEIKEKPFGSYRGLPVPPVQKAGSIALESATWHNRELLARQRLQQIDKLDNFQQGDRNKRTNLFNAKPVEQRQTIGVPLHTVNNTGRRHIIADIPIYVPQYGAGYPSNQTVVTNVQALPLDRVYQNTIPNANTGVNQSERPKFPHVPEGISLPHKGALPVGVSDNPNMYSDPVTARQQLEKAEKERIKLERENIQYFDTDPETEMTLSSTRNVPTSVTEKGNGRNRTLMSDPGPGRNIPPPSDGLEDLKYSPEGFLAEKRRQHRLEKEAKMQQRYHHNNSLESITDEWGPDTYRDAGRYSNRDSKDGSFRPDIRKRRDERENSWFRDPGNTGRSTDAGTYRNPESNYSGKAYNIPHTMNPRGQSPVLAAREQGKDSNRSYQILTDLRDRDRYGDRNSYRIGDENMDRNRRNYDREMQRGYANHLAREREMNEPDNRQQNEHSPDFRARYKVSSDYPTGSEYPQDVGYRPDRETVDRQERRDDRPPADLDKGGYSKTSKEESGGKPKDGEKKVQYVLRSKSGLSKSQLSQRSGSLPENIPPPATEMMKRDDRSSQPSQPGTVRDDPYTNLQSHARQDPIGSEKTKATVQEARASDASARPEERERAADKDRDDLNKYFDDAYDPKDPANKIPFYSDNVSRYSKQKHDLRGGDVKTMTPVQETSMRQSEEDAASHGEGIKESAQDPSKDRLDPYARSDRKEGKYVGRNPSSLLDNSTPKLELLKTKYPSTTENKHYIEEGRRSPWRKEEKAVKVEEKDSAKGVPDSQPDGPDFSSVAKHSGKGRDAKGLSSVEHIKERIREKTLEKMREKGRELSGGDLFRPAKEKTMDSQGPDWDDRYDRPEAEKSRNRGTDNKGQEQDGLENLDDIETELDEKELYVCYLMTDNGEAIGPLRLDIDDVQLGLPKPLEKPGQEDQEDAEGKIIV